MENEKNNMKWRFIGTGGIILLEWENECFRYEV